MNSSLSLAKSHTANYYAEAMYMAFNQGIKFWHIFFTHNTG
jgi:hypothetical protein